jgi:PAS domain S-box-containing protein
MYLRVLYLVAAVFVIGVMLVLLMVMDQVGDYLSVAMLLAMSMTLLSALTIASIRFNAGKERFIIGAEDEDTSRFAKIVNGQRELITCFTPDGEFLFANDSYCDYVGKNRSEIVGTSIFGDVPAEEARSVRESIATKIRARQSWNFKNNLTGLDGIVRTFEWSNAAYFNENGEVVEIHSVGRDVTESASAVV